MKKTDEFIKIILDIEVRRILSNYSASDDVYGQCLIEKILTEIAFNYIKKGDADIANYICKITDSSLSEMLDNREIIASLMSMKERELEVIAKAIGGKEIIDNTVLILTALGNIITGYSLHQLTGLKYFISPQPYNQNIIDQLNKTYNEQRVIEAKQKVLLTHCTEEIPKLINFVKQSVFTV